MRNFHSGGLRKRYRSSASILAIFAAGEVGVWFDPFDLTTLFQDTAGTVPVTAPGQTVAQMRDKSPNAKHATQATAAARPIYGIHPKTGIRNLLTDTDAMATQNVTVAAGTHTLSFTSSGTVTLTGAATGSLIGGGTLTFTATAGTLTLTVVGSVTFAQLERGSVATAYQKVVTRYEITEAGVPSVHYLYAGGASDPRWMVTPALNFTGTDKMTVWAAARKLSDAATASLVELSASTAANTGVFAIFAPVSGGAATYSFLSKGTAQVVATTPASYAAPNTSIIAGIGDISADTTAIRANGAQVAASASDQGTGNYGNHALYLMMRAGTSLPFNGYFYGLIARGAQSNAAQLAMVEGDYNAKLGAY